MKIALSIAIALIIGLFAGLAVPQSSQDITVSGSYKDVDYRLDKLEAGIASLQNTNKLEARIADLEKRIKELETKSRVLTIPYSQVTPGEKMPPGARAHEFNGMRYWTVPVGRE